MNRWVARALENKLSFFADQVWVDSDGKVAYNGARVAGMSDPRGNSAEGPPSEAALMDQQWHMLTVSTQPNGVKGYRWDHPLSWSAKLLPDVTVPCRTQHLMLSL